MPLITDAKFDFFPDGATSGALTTINLPPHIVAAEVSAAPEPTVVTTLGRRVDLPYGDSAEISIHNGEAQYIGKGQAKASSELEGDVTEYHTHWFQKTVRIKKQDIEKYRARGLPWFESMVRDMIHALPRALDYAFIHAIDARTGIAVPALSPAVHDSPLVFNADGATVYAGLDAAQQALYAAGFYATAVALDGQFGAALATARGGLSEQRLYPDFNPLTASLVEGLRSVVSPAVGARNKEQSPKSFEPIIAVVGDWRNVLWDIVMPAKLEYFTSGDPDNSGRDLAAFNEVAWRMEIAYAYGYKSLEQFALITGTPKLGSGVGVTIPGVERIEVSANKVDVAPSVINVAELDGVIANADVHIEADVPASTPTDSAPVVEAVVSDAEPPAEEKTGPFGKSARK